MFKIVLLVVGGLIAAVLIGDVVLRRRKARTGNQASNDGSVYDLRDALDHLASEKQIGRQPEKDD